MKFSELLSPLKASFIRGAEPPGDVQNVHVDSRQVQPSSVYVAVRGLKQDGHDFLPQAISQGAAVLVVENPGKVPEDFRGLVCRVQDSRKTLDLLAARFHGYPSRDLFVVGVTGTNGKTTTSHMVESILNDAQIPTGVMGTIDFHLGTSVMPSTHTTPDPLALQKILEAWRRKGARAVSMEVSSHALEMKRADSVEFDVAIFTNLTRDHIDLHGSMENYRGAKARLFQELLEKSVKKHKRAILNQEDPSHKRMISPSIPHWLFGVDSGDLKVTRMDLSLNGTEARVVTPVGESQMRLKMIGRHNVLNALGSLGAALHQGVSLQAALSSLERLKGVRGRLEAVPNSNGIHVFVDYAHTDDALLNVLGFLRGLQRYGRLITVFGCGGDRDRGKRPMMAKAAVNTSDQVVVTSDNPRTEDPQKIVDDILAGIPKDRIDKTVFVEVDRRLGIKKALELARPGDAVLVAGKGHEDYQIIGSQKFPFDDVQVVQQILGCALGAP